MKVSKTNLYGALPIVYRLAPKPLNVSEFLRRNGAFFSYFPDWTDMDEIESSGSAVLGDPKAHNKCLADSIANINLIGVSFLWRKTIEGHKFWRRVSDRRANVDKLNIRTRLIRIARFRK